MNALRNKTGTGHGRPFVPSVTDDEARAAVQLIGIVSGLLLRALKRKPKLVAFTHHSGKILLAFSEVTWRHPQYVIVRFIT